MQLPLAIGVHSIHFHLGVQHFTEISDLLVKPRNQMLQKCLTFWNLSKNVPFFLSKMFNFLENVAFFLENVAFFFNFFHFFVEISHFSAKMWGFSLKMW